LKIWDDFEIGKFCLISIFLPALFVVLTACTAVQPEGSAATTSVSIRSPLTASENSIIGTVLWVDSVSREAVIQLSANTAPPPDRLISRGKDLTHTAILVPLGIRRGSTVGVQVLAGSPARGDEVVAPGPMLLKQIEAALGGAGSAARKAE
jgi:hypothetical protein